MNRRNVLLEIMAGGFVVGTSGVVWLGSGSNDRALTVGASLKALDKLMNDKIATLGE
ncbi:MAG: hypothetical protein ACI8SI_002513 [Congregibacter sp.]|jgi:hypothetical protein